MNSTWEFLYLMTSLFFWVVTRCRLVVTDVSGEPIGPVLKSRAVQEELS